MLSFLKNFFLIKNQTNNSYIDKLVLKTTKYTPKIIPISTTTQETALKPIINYTQRPNHYLVGLTSIECYFLRKNKNFNKGRFSRNRQIYRTGVYFCLYINIVTFYSLWYYFYKFKIKFTYVWWLFIILPFSFIHTRALKYNLYFPSSFFFFLKKYLNWFFFKK